MNKLTQFLVDGILNDPKPTLNEGGAYGHLAHPYEDMELTFQDLRKMVDQALIGNLKAFEKTDGQQLSFTWKDGQLRLARNKGHLKNHICLKIRELFLNQYYSNQLYLLYS
jgi:hypothetical protein